MHVRNIKSTETKIWSFLRLETESLNMGAHEANLTQRFLKTGLHVPTTVVPSPQSAPLSYI